MSVAAVLLAQVATTENNAFGSANQSSDRVTLDGGTTPPATKSATFIKTLSSGAGTIDLTALPGSAGLTVDGSTLKVRMIRFKNPVANANNITLTPGASNGYLLFGTAWSVTLAPGQHVTAYLHTGTPTIDSSHKNIDLAGTGSQTLECMFVIG